MVEPPEEIAPAETVADGKASEELTEGDAEGNAAPESAKKGDEEVEQSRRVYIGNLSWGVSWQDLKDHMREAGEVTRADIMTGPDGRSKGCGIVEFSTVDEAKKAVLTLNDTELNGRQIFVREDREERGSRSANKFSSDETAQSRRVYVGNLSWDVAWQDLKDHMVSVHNSLSTMHCQMSAHVCDVARSWRSVSRGSDYRSERTLKGMWHRGIRESRRRFDCHYDANRHGIKRSNDLRP